MGWFQFTTASQVKAMKEAERRFAEAQESERVARAYCEELGLNPNDPAKERKAKRDAGLVPLEVWVPRDKVDEVKAWVARLLKETPTP